MNKLKVLVFIIILLLVYNGSSTAQNYLLEQYNFAEKLYSEGKYYESITEFKRLSFFDSLKQYSFKSNYFIGKCYKGGGKYSDAIQYFSLALKGTRSPDEVYNTKIEIIRSNILRRTTDQALILLEELERVYNNNKREISYWRGWAYIFADDWEKAASSFDKIEKDHPLKKLADSVENDKISMLFPKLISYILPGAGQFYTGEYLSGLMSLCWNSLFIYLSINSFYADRIFDGFITTGLFFRFHRGNVENAEKFARNKNSEISNKALLYLQNSYGGLKP